MKIINFGSCNIDYVYSLDHIAVVGETETTMGIETFCGGKGLNQSIALSRSGAKIYHAGCIGEDGEFLLEILKENNVDVSFVERTNIKNGHAVIQVDKDGGNAIFLYPGSNEMISKAHIDRTLTNFSKGDFLILQNEINNLNYVIEKAYKIGMTIFLNPSPYNETIEQIDLNKISYLMLNEIEAQKFSKLADVQNALKYFRSNFPKLRVMLTLGKNGCIYQDEKEQIFHPIYKVNALDTTAAGDTFTGYFVAGIARKEKIREILRLASCASAICVTKKGAAPSIPYINEGEKHLALLKTDNVDIKTRNIYLKIEEFINENLAEASIKSLADFIGYSPVYAGVLVKKITGETYNHFLRKKRLEKAARLLLETEMTVGDIIKSVGYENESFFRKRFKEHYGDNPLTYRKREVK